MALISVDNVHFHYPEAKEGTDALSGLSLSIEEGSFTVILGSNGSGKSTLGKLLNGLLVPTSGTIRVDGLDTKDKKNLLSVRKTVGIVFQNPDNQIVADTVEEDVAFGPENLGLAVEEIQSRVDSSLKATGLYEVRSRKPEKLSGGQKQRVAIAGVLALEPKCIVLDEATAMLDPEGRKEVLERVRQLQKEKHLAVILITHYMEEALDADQIYVMDQGQLAFSGTPREVFSRREELRHLGLTLPIAKEMAERLREEGIALPSTILSRIELLSALKKALEEKRC